MNVFSYFSIQLCNDDFAMKTTEPGSKINCSSSRRETSDIL